MVAVTSRTKGIDMDTIIEIKRAAGAQRRASPMHMLPIAAGLALALASTTAYAQTKSSVDCVSSQKASEGDATTPRIPQKASEGDATTPKFAQKASEGDATTPRIPQKASEGDATTPKIAQKASEGDATTPRIPQKASEGDATTPRIPQKAAAVDPCK